MNTMSTPSSRRTHHVSVLALGLAFSALAPGCVADTGAPLEDEEVSSVAQADTGAASGIAEPGSYVRITARHSGKCLGVSGYSMADEAWLLQWDCDGSDDEAFRFDAEGAGPALIRAKHSNKCLAVSGDYVVQRDCAAAPRFNVAKNGDGSYSIVLADAPQYDVSAPGGPVSGPRVFNVEGGSTANGARVLVYPSHGGNNQRFTSLAYRDSASLAACAGAPAATSDLASCGGHFVSNAGCWSALSPDPLDACRRYGVNFGASWGPGYFSNQYYDAIDRCAYWHDYHTWDNWAGGLNDNYNDSQAWLCMAMVQPASIEEDRARQHAVYWLAHDPATLSRAGHYVDPRLISRTSGRRPTPFPTAPAGGIPQRDAFMQVPWATQQGGYWDSQQWVAGDFDNDGTTDLAKVFNDGGLSSADVHLTGVQGFTMGRWETQGGGYWDTQKWMAGDFDKDGKADLVNVFNDGGLNSIDVHLSSGHGFTRTRWETQGGGFWDTQKWLVGDFNGDHRADLANVFDDGGLDSIDVHLSSGSSMTRTRWETQGGGFWDAQKWVVGDFDGDGNDDIANIFNDGGLVSIDVHISSQTGFTRQRWVTRQGTFDDGQKWMAMRRTIEDSDLHPKSDLVVAYFDNGYDSIAVRRATGNTFAAPEIWATRYGVDLGRPAVSPAVWAAQKWLAGTFNTVGSVARVYGDGGLASIVTYLR